MWGRLAASFDLCLKVCLMILELPIEGLNRKPGSTWPIEQMDVHATRHRWLLWSDKEHGISVFSGIGQGISSWSEPRPIAAIDLTDTAWLIESVLTLLSRLQDR